MTDPKPPNNLPGEGESPSTDVTVDGAPVDGDIGAFIGASSHYVLVGNEIDNLLGLLKKVEFSLQRQPSSHPTSAGRVQPTFQRSILLGIAKTSL